VVVDTIEVAGVNDLIQDPLGRMARTTGHAEASVYVAEESKSWLGSLVKSLPRPG
jgi:hypothetical protein